MKIINPLYDYAFKYLMQNNRIAKKVIGTILECEIIELIVEQQEIIAVDETRGLKLYRLDFSAIIVDKEGKHQKVLIELQKSKLPTNLLRFRTYLGENYRKKETFTNDSGVEETRIYPIISIYILGYNVVDIPYLSVNIDNKVTNTVTKEEVNVSSDFITFLTHRTYIIQIRRLSEKRQSRLEQFLTIFNQSWATSDKYILNIPDVPEEFDDIVKYLTGPVLDEDFRNKLKAEEEIDEIFRSQEAELAEKNAALQASILKIQQEKQRADKAEETVKQFAVFLLNTGLSITEISQKTGLTEEIIKNLKN
jgi:hypothetical protein